MNDQGSSRLVEFRLKESDRRLIDQILKPAEPKVKRGITVHEGYRFLCFGETGSGKTSLQRAVIMWTLAKGYANQVFIHDTKGIFPEYPFSTEYANVGEFQKRGFVQGNLPVISFRGNVRAGIACPAEEVALFAKTWVQTGRVNPVTQQWEPDPTVLVEEEIAEASMKGRKHLNAPSIVWFAEQGRKVGGSFVGTTQSPRKVPIDLLSQASSVAFFRLTGHDANFLADVLELPGPLVDTLRGSGNEGLPNYQYCLFEKGGVGWDGEVHSLDKSTALLLAGE